MITGASAMRAMVGVKTLHGRARGGRTTSSSTGGRTMRTMTGAMRGDRAGQIKKLLQTVNEDLSGGDAAVTSVAEARALIARTRAEKKRREVMAPTSARLAALEAEAEALRDEVRQLRDENQEAVDALLAEAAELAEQTARVDEVEGELEEARELNKRLVSAAKELAELIDESSTDELEAKLAAKDAEIAALKVSLHEIEAKLEDRDALLATIRGLEIELADSYTNAELAELAGDNVNSPGLILALEAENKEMRERIAVLLKGGASLPAVEKKYEAAALEVISLKSRIRLLEVQMSDMVDQEELNEILQVERSNNTLLAEVTAQKDDLLKRIRELEVAMSDMEEADAYLKAKKETEMASMRNMDLNTLVTSLTAKLAEQTEVAEKAKEITNKALENIRALEGDMAYMDYAPEIANTVKAAKQMASAAERTAELAAGLQQLEAGMSKKSTERKTPFKRDGGSFSLRKKVFDKTETENSADTFTRASADSFTLRKFDFSKVRAAQTTTNKAPFKRAPESAFKLRKMAFPFSARGASVPTRVFVRSNNFELRRFIFTSDPVDLAASGTFERTGEFTLRKLSFPPSSRSSEAVAKSSDGDSDSQGSRIFKF
mmetsp:Transcript_6906/g.22743  ORF Transcript_6906/g.22743 Transcript_6906/m.22743 type:complete len:607 (+) Transcript_6906:98-1918(+)